MKNHKAKQNLKIMQFFIGLLLIVTFFSCDTGNKIASPDNLTVSEGLTNPIGFYDASPTFSWKLPADVKAQSAYSIAVASSPDLLPDNADLWKSGKIDSDQTSLLST